MNKQYKHKYNIGDTVYYLDGYRVGKSTIRGIVFDSQTVDGVLSSSPIIPDYFLEGDENTTYVEEQLFLTKQELANQIVESIMD